MSSVKDVREGAESSSVEGGSGDETRDRRGEREGCWGWNLRSETEEGL